eukprot:gnl/MRDRNA2_/MRDRNA2_84334_c0_seq4.p1 gnl/MRDRNA2_/MRDRNA2_84334_c0~~gnl/MRDRNA2_/MRDRNA2_84334_c0_seq4.p1  ORF type:complete len:713 (-),score=263.05 gnl/MRDRNA2_/MRDRNA2_84334_c0_seq4:19-2079(-)
MMRIIFLCALLPIASAANTGTNPVEKVIEMLGDLQQKIIGEGQASQKVYDEFAEWCEEESKTLQFEIKTGKAEVEELNAVIEKAKSDISGFDEKIEALSSELSTDEADLKAATDIREKEHGLFVTEEGELVDTVDILERAIGILEREMAKNPGASLVQLQSAGNLVQSLKSLVEAHGISTGDASRLTALLQSQSHETTLAEDAAASETGAPDPAAYKGHGGGIIEVLNDLLADAQGQLDEARKKEMDSQHNYDVMKLEISDAIKFGKKELDKTQKNKAAAGETQATAEGDLAVVSKSLAEDIKQLADTHHDCMTKAQDFELEMKSRAEELKALAEAKKVISEMTGGATSQTYSFLQVSTESRLKTQADLANFEAVRHIEALARRLGSTALAQLAQRMDAAARLGGTSGDDPFAKVKGLIKDMIAKLLKEAEEEASHKGFCDKEMSETKTKKEDLSDEIEKLTAKIDKASAESAKLKDEVKTLQKELADLEKSQAEMDKIREEENTQYKADKEEMEQGLEGIKLALKVLREYYGQDAAHGSASGAGGGIISMLEVIESDFTKGLEEMITAEETAVADYKQQTKENDIAKVTKTQDVKYKTKEAKSLDAAVAEATSDRTGLETELSAVLDYYESLKKQCIAKPESYEERKKRREAEIAGLKEALEILNGAAVFLQNGQPALRGVNRHQ